MAQWEILLDEFSQAELNRWSGLFHSPACKVARDEKGDYCLTAQRFEKLKKEEQVNKSAERLITMLKAFDKIESDILRSDDGKSTVSHIRKREGDNYTLYTYKNGSLRSLQEKIGDTTNVTVFVETVGAVAQVGQVTVEIRDEHDNIEPQKREENIPPQKRQERWYNYFLECDDWIDKTSMFEALEYFAAETEPRTLRNAYEKVRADEGGKEAILENGWFNKTRLDDFWDFLHYHDHGGRELHTMKKEKPPSISLEEAQIFVGRDLLKNWLIKKERRLRRCYPLQRA